MSSESSVDFGREFADARPGATIESRRALAHFRASVLGRGSERLRLGRYEVQGQLGRGGEGLVYAAYDHRLEREVAIKIPSLHASARDRERLLHEAKALAMVRHPNVVTVYDAGISGDGDDIPGVVYVVMERVKGQTLARWLEAEARPWGDTLRPFIAAAHGLEAIHRAGLVHRDVKPSNVLMSDDGRVLVIDLGFCEAHADIDRARGDVTMAGTPRYMAPEVLQGRAPSSRSDQYSLCQAALEALGGAPLFTEEGDSTWLESKLAPAGSSAPMSRAGGPRSIWRTLQRGLDPSPERRHASMAALARDLERRQRWWRWRRRGALGIGLVALLAAGAAWTHDERLSRCERPSASRTALAARVEGMAERSPSVAVRTSVELLSEYVAQLGRLETEACRHEVSMRSEVARALELCIVEHQQVVETIVDAYGRARAPDGATLLNGIRQIDPPRECRWWLESFRTAATPDDAELELAAGTGRLIGLLVMEDLEAATAHADSLSDAAGSWRSHARLALWRAWVPRLRNDRQGQREQLERAIRLAEQSGDDATVTRAMISGVALESAGGNFERARALAAHARSRLVHRSLPPRDRALLDYYESLGRVMAGSAETTLWRAASAVWLTLWSLGPSHPLLSDTLFALGASARATGHFELASLAYSWSLAAIDRTYGPTSSRGWRPLTQLASIAGQWGRLERARSLYEAALDRIDTGDPAFTEAEGIAQQGLGWVLVKQGHYGRGVERLRHAVRLRASRDPDSLGVAELYLFIAMALEWKGDHVAATDALAEGTSVLERSGQDGHTVIALRARIVEAVLMVEDGRPEAALARFEAIEAEPRSITVGSLGGYEWMERGWAAALAAGGRPEEAAERLRALLRRQHTQGVPALDRASAQVQLARLLEGAEPCRALELAERAERALARSAPEHPQRRVLASLRERLSSGPASLACIER